MACVLARHMEPTAAGSTYHLAVHVSARAPTMSATVVWECCTNGAMCCKTPKIRFRRTRVTFPVYFLLCLRFSIRLIYNIASLCCCLPLPPPPLAVQLSVQMQHVSNNASTFAPFFLRRLLSSFTRRGAVTARSSRQFGTSSPMISLAQAPFWYVPPPCFRWCTLLFSLCLLRCAISAGRAPFFDAVSKNMEKPHRWVLPALEKDGSGRRGCLLSSAASSRSLTSPALCKCVILHIVHSKRFEY